MTISYDVHGSVAGATDYFAHRLHERPGPTPSSEDREKALGAARGIIDGLNYKGNKHTSRYLYALSADCLGWEYPSAWNWRQYPAIGKKSRSARNNSSFRGRADTGVPSRHGYRSPEVIERACTRSPIRCWTAKTRKWSWRIWRSRGIPTGQ